MSTNTIPRFGSDSKTVFYQTRFEIQPEASRQGNIWPQIMKTIQAWLEEKEEALEEKGKPNLLERLTSDIVNYSELVDGLSESCYISEHLASGNLLLETRQSRIETRAIFSSDSEIIPSHWAMEYIEQDSSNWYRRWYTDLGITALGNNSYAVNARVSIADDPAFLISQPRIPYRNTPRFARKMLEIPGCITLSGDSRLPSREIWLNAVRFGAFVKSLTSASRTVPLVVVSSFKDDPDAYAIDTSKLAENLRGTAIVYVLNLSNAETRREYQRAFAYGTPAYDYRVDSGFARVYFPGVDLSDIHGSKRHHFYTPEKLQGTRVGEIENDICGAITRLYHRRPNEVLTLSNITTVSSRLKRKSVEAKMRELEQKLRNSSEAASNAHKQLDKADYQEECQRLQEKLKQANEYISFQDEFIAALEESPTQDESEEEIQSLRGQLSELQSECNALNSTVDAQRYTISTLQLNRQKNDSAQQTMAQQARLIREVRAFPRTPLESLSFAETAFSDRIVVLQEATDSAEDFESGNADETYDILRSIAMVLWPMYFEENETQPGDIERDFRSQTGYEISFSESSQTNKNPKLMKLRKRIYDGREIDISPHVKGTSGKRTEPLRVHFAVDDATKKIVIGHCGAHLDTAGTRRVR